MTAFLSWNQPCVTCSGSGRYSTGDVRMMGNALIGVTICPSCNGSGFIVTPLDGDKVLFTRPPEWLTVDDVVAALEQETP